jgi:hypothetical protein
MYTSVMYMLEVLTYMNGVTFICHVSMYTFMLVYMNAYNVYYAYVTLGNAIACPSLAGKG